MAVDPEQGPQGAASSVAEDMAWLRAVARRLARDPSEADDLAQDAWLASQRAHAAEARSRRAWLSGVLRNRERMLRRGEVRRRRRESASVDARVHEDAEVELHRHRVLSSVQEALQGLDESDRSLLLGRYCDGLDAAELGLRLGIPASTVRSRLSRATARVRRNLDERWGGNRAAWAPAVLAMPVSRRVEVSLLTVSGGLLVSALLKKIVIVIAVALAAWGIWSVARTTDDASPGRTTTAESPSDRSEGSIDRGAPTDADAHEGIVLAGRVVSDDGGAPVPRAVVMAVPASGGAMISTTPGHASIVPRAIADDDGRFALAGLPEGAYGLTAAAPGHLPTRVSAALLAKAGDATELVLRLRAGGNRIEGTVTDITGGPVEGELVRARPPGDSATGPERAGYGAITDADGRYVLSVPDGGWTLVAGGEDYSRETRRVEVKNAPGRADFVLVPAGSIHGRVIDRATGEPLAGAVVDFAFHMRLGSSRSSSISNEEEATRTDAQGRFELRPLKPGQYTLHAAGPGRGSADEPVVHVALGEQVTDVVLEVDPAFDVTGIVVDAAHPDQGLAGVSVTAHASDENGRWFTVTEGDGTFRLSGLRSGAYLMRFEGGGAIASMMEHTLRVDEADVKDARFELSRGVPVTGRVTPPTAGDVRVRGRVETGGFEVLLQSRKVQQAKSRIADDGTFAIDGVPPGEWKIIATGDDGSEGVLEIDVPAEGLADAQVSMEPRPRVAGVVQDGSGASLPGIVVNVQAEPDPAMPPGPWQVPKTVASAVSRDDGSFDVVGVTPGRYTIALQDGRKQPVPVVDGSAPVVVEPAAGRDVTDLVLRARLPHERITGVVRDGSGEPVADAWVQARVASGFGLDTELTMAAITEADGRFTLEALAPGEYQLAARGPDADAQATVPKVSTGEDVTITLEAFGEIEGRVVLGGRPVTQFRIEAGMGEKRRVIAADGRFVLERMPPGEHSLSVVTEDGSAHATADVKPGEVASVTLEVAGWGSLQGVVVSAIDGTPIAGLAVDVDSDSGMRRASEQLASALSGSGGIVTDAEGKFSVDGVGAGQVTVSFSIGAYASSGEENLGARAVELAAGEHVDLGEIKALPPAKIPAAERGSLGVELQASPTFPVDHKSKTGDKHVWVTWLEPGGPAERAGLEVGDRVTALDGIDEATIGWQTLTEALGRARIRTGQRYTLTVERDGQPRDVRVRAAAKREE